VCAASDHSKLPSREIADFPEFDTPPREGFTMTNRLHFISMIIALLASVPGTAMAQSIPDGFYYKLSTKFRGAGMKLDVFNGGPKNNMTRLEQDQNVTGQF